MKYVSIRIQKYGKYMFLIIGILFIAYGVMREEQLLMFEKAIHICFECIGIG